jgi:hypothetical protein
MEKFVDVMDKDFQSSVKDWKTKVDFDKEVRTKNNAIEGEEGTDNDIYRFVSAGTKRHYVAPRRAKVLAFKPNYKTKSVAGTIPSRSGGASGNMAFSKGHYVSGIKAREYPKQIAKKRMKDFVKIMTDAIIEVSEE